MTENSLEELRSIYEKYAEDMYEYFLKKSRQSKTVAIQLSTELWTAFFRRKGDFLKQDDEMIYGWLRILAEELAESIEE